MREAGSGGRRIQRIGDGIGRKQRWKNRGQISLGNKLVYYKLILSPLLSSLYSSLHGPTGSDIHPATDGLGFLGRVLRRGPAGASVHGLLTN